MMSEQAESKLRTVLLAGGRGRRLEPFTTVLPKPLAPVGELPIIEILLRQLSRDGFHDVVISLGYLGELIEAYLARRNDSQLQIEFVHEETPLGTAGALSLVDDLGGDVLVVNGDVLTDLCFQDIVATHRRTGAALTLAVQRRQTKIAFGVLDSSDGFVTEFREKPEIELDCSIGVNVYGPSALRLARNTVPTDFPDVVQALLAAGERVAVHNHRGYWCDIGTRDDYERAQVEFEDRRDSIVSGRRLPDPTP